MIRKRTLFDISRYILSRLEDYPSDFIERVVTQNETWVHHFDPESKMQIRKGLGLIFLGTLYLLSRYEDDPVSCKNSEYDQEIPQSQITNNPMAPGGRAAQPSRDTRKTNLAKQPALSSPSR